MKCETHQIEIGRYGPCTLCLMEKEGGSSEFARHFMGIRTTVLCDCHKPAPNGMALPDPACERCGGTGECEIAPF